MFGKNHRRPVRPRRSGLSFQELEPRLPLTGNVMVVQQGDLVTITGDPAANGIELQKTALGTLRITGIPIGDEGGPTALVMDGRATDQMFLFGVSRLQLSLGRGDDKVIFGSQGAANLPRTVLSSLAVDLGDGANQFSGDGLAVVGDATFRSGRHDDLLSFRNASFVTFSVMTGQGDDFITISNDVEVQQAASIDVFRGNDVISIRDRVLMRSTCTILGGGENDVVSMKDGVVVRSDLVVDLGGGNDGFYADNFVGVAGQMTLLGQGGNEAVYLENDFAVVGDLSIDVGGGNDQVVLRNDVSAGSNVTVQLGSGESDEFLEACRTDGATVQVAGNVTILKQRGHARVSAVGNVPEDRPRFRIGGDYIVEVGGSADLFLYGEVGRDMSVRATGGAVSATLYKSSVSRNVSILTGGTEDRVSINSVTVSGTVRIETGESNDYVSVENIDIAGGTTLQLGSGNDRLSIRGTFRSAGSFDGGAGRRDEVTYPRQLLLLIPPLLNFETSSVQ
jgi:hypothetical protein